MSDTVIALSSALQKTATALAEFSTQTSKNYNPSDIDDICGAASDLLEEAETRINEGAVLIEITWQDVHQVFPSLSKEDAVEFMTVNRSDIVAHMKDAALKSIQERGVSS